MYGYTFNKQGEITGEQDVLRYSALDCWLKSRESYRKRYYQGQSFQTVETVFGHEGHKKLENKEVVLEGLPAYPTTEHNIIATLGRGGNTMKIGGCLDSFDEETCSFLDYKFSHRSKEGKAPWDAVKVARHMQLVFYGLLVELKYGKVNPWTKLVWVETAFDNKVIEFAGHTLSAPSRKLSLTGHWQAFPRRVAKWERVALKKIIKRASDEIKEDFNNYKNANRQEAGEQGDERDGPTLAQEEPEVEGVLSGGAKEVGGEEKA